MTYEFINEPRDEDYQSLIQHIASIADRFSVVVRPDLEQSPSLTSELQLLQPHLVSAVRSDSWPGTQLIGSTADVYTYRWSAAAQDWLQDRVRGLYDWQQPENPEDLAIYRRNGEVLLNTVAHEHWGQLTLTVEEYCGLPPGLRLKLQPVE